MANLDNQSKKRYYPLRDAKNPYKVSLVEITEAQYKALYPEIWATQKREQYHHRCMCPKKYNWKCDGNCELCEYQAAGDMLSLDVPTEDGNANGSYRPYWKTIMVQRGNGRLCKWLCLIHPRTGRSR